MFGISWAEFLVILLVAVLVIPTRYWPDVARALARAVKFIRALVWKITDAGEKIKEQIELEKPINDLMQTTTKEMLDAFSVKKTRKQKKRRVQINEENDNIRTFFRITPPNLVCFGIFCFDFLPGVVRGTMGSGIYYRTIDWCLGGCTNALYRNNRCLDG